MKIFGIGLSKTGTNSLCDALTHLGFDMLHYPPPSIFDALERCDGCADLPTVVHYKELDEKFPGSKFVLTTRDRSKWLKSIIKHFERRPPSTLGDWGEENRVKVYGSLHPTPADFLKAYEKHHADIRDYFKDRPDDLLELNITDEDDDALIWEGLCRFFTKEVPDMPFPHGNAAPAATGTVDVVIPYVHNPNGWDELRYAVRALAKNFVDLRHLWIVGDQPDWANDEVKVITRDVSLSKNDVIRNFNYCQSMWIASNYPEISDDFLYLADDHYILTPRTAQNFRETVLVRENMAAYTQAERLTADREWQLMIWDTVDACLSLSLAGWNYETHTPKLVNKHNMREMFATFGYGNGRLIWQTAYGNMFPPPDGYQGYLSEETTLKAGFYETVTYDEVKAKADDAIYMNHNDDGLCDGVKQYLRERFPDPCKFES